MLFYDYYKQTLDFACVRKKSIIYKNNDSCRQRLVVVLTLKGQGLEFDMKNHILHVSGTYTAFKEKSSDHFKETETPDKF